MLVTVFLRPCKCYFEGHCYHKLEGKLSFFVPLTCKLIFVPTRIAGRSRENKQKKKTEICGSGSIVRSSIFGVVHRLARGAKHLGAQNGPVTDTAIVKFALWPKISIGFVSSAQHCARQCGTALSTSTRLTTLRVSLEQLSAAVTVLLSCKANRLKASLALVSGRV